MKKALEVTEKDNIEKYIKLGKTYKDIASIYNVNPETIARISRKYKFSHYNLDYFEKIDSEKKAYILGFILADGCITRSMSKDGYTLEITINKIDLHLLELIRDEIAPANNIFYKKDNTVSLRICSKKICEDIINNYNILPNKSHIIDLNIYMNNIPNIYINHFIRGYFDGDGHFGTSTTKHYLKKKNIVISRKRLMRFGFTGSNIIFLNFLKSFFENLGFKSKLYNRDKYTNNLFFNLNKKNYKIIYDFFYENTTIFLIRKKETILNNAILNNTEVTSEISKGSEAP